MTTKFHFLRSLEGHVLEGFLTPGNTADMTVAKQLCEKIVGCLTLADMGYDSDEFRQFLRENNNEPVIPGRKNRKIKIVYDTELYNERRRVEMTFGALKENKRLDTRFDKLDDTFLGFFALGFIKILLGIYLC